MPTNVDSRSDALARRSKRYVTAIAVTAAAVGDLMTVPAGTLNGLQPGDVVTLTAMTGGTGLPVVNTDLYLLANPATVGSGAYFPAGATTCQLALSPGGPAIDITADLTAGTLNIGRVESVLSLTGAGNHPGVSPLAPRGR